MLDQFNNPMGAEASYNQAQQQMFRINENLILSNRCMINPLMVNYELGGIYNYEACFNCLCSVLSEIYPKLKPDEQKLIVKFRGIIRRTMELKPIFEIINIENGLKKKRTNKLNKNNWEELQDLLFKFRLEIESLMDVHGFGNPSKRDPSKAITEM